ncbi:MAG: SpoIID/LytB domain-containing protein [Bacteroidales bacterium]|jgi:stage II sporulation protein D|nr:SpoIID/LytB domain-containing protein [Bacteroidales bacterium]
MRKNNKIHLFTQLLLVFFFVFSSFGLKAQKIDVRIFSTNKIKEISLVPSFGNYVLQLKKGNNKIEKEIELNRKDIIKIQAKNNNIGISINDSLIGDYEKVELLSQGLMNFFKISTDNSDIKPRHYDDNLIITLKNGNELFLINNVELESYISGVVQAETWGATKNVDFFKLQAICVRNYIMRNAKKHSKEDFQLCDDVHCQAYKGRANKAEVIFGAYDSKGEVIVDSLGNIIETLFHANSGGYTESSENVWGRPFSHLLGKRDTFSMGGKSYLWEKYIKLKDWKRYFKDKGIDVRNDSIENILVNFSQKDGRKKDLLGVPLVQIRKDFNLRSTFFDCKEWGSEVKLEGRGYGHGVGMSQQGAIIMCEQGYEYWQVIEFYYTGAKVKRVDEEKEFK